jgi:hypothetical protein
VQGGNQCVIDECDIIPAWNGGSCYCNTDSDCSAGYNGWKCIGNNGAPGICGCLSQNDCGFGTCTFTTFKFNGVTAGYCK